MKAEEQLKQIASEGEWDIPKLTELQAGAGQLVDVMTTMIQTEWKGAAPDAAAVAFTALRNNFQAVEQGAAELLDLLRGANTSRSKAIAAIDGLSSATVDPAIVATARTASAVIFRGFTFPADGAIGLIENMLGNEREEQAQAALDDLHNDLGIYGDAMMNSIQSTAIVFREPVMPDVTPVVVPDSPPSSYPPARVPGGTTPPSYPTSPALTPAPVATGIGLYQPPVIIDPPVVDEHYWPPTGPSVDAPVIGQTPIGTIPTGPTTPGTFPGGSSDFGNGGSGGQGSGGVNGAPGSGGMGAGLIGGGAGAAAAAAAAAKARLGGGSSGAGGFGNSGARVGAGGLGGAHGIGSAGSAAGGSGVGGTGGTGAAGGAGRLGGGGLLGSQGGGAAGGGNTTVATTNAAGAGGRGAGGMMGGGGGGSEDRERRGGLGGMMAPKLDDESDAAPRSAGASAGGRDAQPTD